MLTKIIKLLLLIGFAVFLAGCKNEIDQGDQIDEDLSHYKKPVIEGLIPPGIIYNNMGFTLVVKGGFFENSYYVLYLNNRKFNSTYPEYMRTKISWEIPADFLAELVNAAGGTNDITVKVRVTPIQTDISNNFDRYADYISNVALLRIKRNHTTFTSPARLFPLWENSSDPVLRTDNTGNLYLAWREQVNDIYQAFFSFSEDEGETWSQVLNISRSANNVARVDMVSDGAGHFYLVWNEYDDNAFSQVYFSRSLDNGVTWWNPFRLSLENESSKNPDIEVDATGRIFVAWTDAHQWDTYNNLRLAFSPDQGNSWQYRVMVENGFLGGEPAMKASENGNIYLICGVPNQGIYCFYSSDYGNDWDVNQANSDFYFWVGQYSSLKIGLGEKLFLTWNNQDSAGHTFHNWIHFISGMNKGADWNEHQYLNNVCNVIGPKAAMTVNGTQVNMLMHSGQSLFILRSTDEGATWSYPEFIPGTTISTVWLDMVTGDTGRIYLVYIQANDSSPENHSIYFIRTQ